MILASAINRRFTAGCGPFTCKPCHLPQLIHSPRMQPNDVKGVAVMAPATAQMVKTILNPKLYLNGTPASVVAANEFFGGDFPIDTPLTLIRGDKDAIVKPKEVDLLYAAAVENGAVSV